MNWNNDLNAAPQGRMIRIRYRGGEEANATRSGPLFFPGGGEMYTYATIVAWRELSESELAELKHRKLAALHTQAASVQSEIRRLEGEPC